VDRNHAAHFQAALICAMGHVIHDRPSDAMLLSQAYCLQCGAQGIYRCQHCQALIRGFNPLIDGVAGRMQQAPKYCPQCGEPYPWMQDGAETMALIIDVLDDLTDEERIGLKASIKDLLELTPGTSQAMALVKDLSGKIKGTWGWGILADILKDLASEDVKTQLGIGD